MTKPSFEEWLRLRRYTPTQYQLAFIKAIDKHWVILPAFNASGRSWVLKKLEEYYNEHGFKIRPGG